MPTAPGRGSERRVAAARRGDSIYASWIYSAVAGLVGGGGGAGRPLASWGCGSRRGVGVIVGQSREGPAACRSHGGKSGQSTLGWLVLAMIVDHPRRMSPRVAHAIKKPGNSARTKQGETGRMAGAGPLPARMAHDRGPGSRQPAWMDAAGRTGRRGAAVRRGDSDFVSQMDQCWHRAKPDTATWAGRSPTPPKANPGLRSDLMAVAKPPDASGLRRSRMCRRLVAEVGSGMRREPGLTFEGALRILGKPEHSKIEAIDKLLGGLILGAGATSGLVALGVRSTSTRATVWRNSIKVRILQMRHGGNRGDHALTLTSCSPSMSRRRMPHGCQCYCSGIQEPEIY